MLGHLADIRRDLTLNILLTVDTGDGGERPVIERH
ncbi:hypothetical protein SDC9_170540 [bioreactor metagenome]|uniref:Uncharacterized protein n=1 Tax=bioreactor metagenome TaxID=1076179 RepID=A0A645GHE0_9ZZZZ